MNMTSLKAYTISSVDSMADDLESPLHLPLLDDKATLVDKSMEMLGQRENLE